VLYVDGVDGQELWYCRDKYKIRATIAKETRRRIVIPKEIDGWLPIDYSNVQNGEAGNLSAISRARADLSSRHACLSVCRSAVMGLCAAGRHARAAPSAGRSHAQAQWLRLP
jgi:hypothetical protein